MTEEDFQLVYARALKELSNARNAFAGVFRGLVMNVEDYTLYSRGSLANLAKEQGLVEKERGKMLFFLLGHILNRADFDNNGDGTIDYHGVPIPAWQGMRWKAALWEVVMEEKARSAPVMRVLIEMSWVGDQE